MMMRLIQLSIVLTLLLIGCLPAAAQGCGQSNPNCIVPTAPAGSNDERAASTAFVQQNSVAGIVNATAFGAVCDGVTDDSAAINNAINSFPLPGAGIVILPAADCKVSSQINIGNGTSSVGSTRQGIILRGTGSATKQNAFPGFLTGSGTRLIWGGGAGIVVAINGPLQGWGVENLAIDCQSSAAFGLQLTSAQLGYNPNIAFINCIRSVVSATVAPFGSFTNTDSSNNTFVNTSIAMPSLAGALGTLLTGGTTSISSYNTFINTNIFFTTSVINMVAVYLQSANNNHFVNTHVFGGNASAACVSFDYTVSNAFPSGNRFTGIDIGTCGGGGTFTTAGTPGGSSRPNQVFIDETSSTICPLIVNTSCFGSHSLVTNPGGNVAGTDTLAAWTAFTMNPVCGTATITPTSARAKVLGKTTFVEYDLNITALGTCTNTLTVNLPNTANTGGAISGRASSAGKGVALQVSAAGTTAVGTQSDNTNFATGQILLSGVYENQ